LAVKLEIPPHLESLWLWRPHWLTDAQIEALEEAIYDVDGATLKIPAFVLDGARLGRPIFAVEFADRIYESSDAFPRLARRLVLSALALIPTAYRRNWTSCQRLIGLFGRLLRASPDPEITALLAPHWREVLAQQIDDWRKWCDTVPRRYTAASAPPGFLFGRDAHRSDPKPAKRERRSMPPRAVARTEGIRTKRILRVPIPDFTLASGCDLRRFLVLQEPLPLGDQIDGTALDALDLAFPQFAEVTKSIRLESQLAAASDAKSFRLMPRLLVGPPGVGKSRYLRALGEAIARPVRILSAASGDGRALTGTARGWSSAVPSFPIVSIVELRRADPLLIIDEIDKADRNGGLQANLQAALLSLLESATAVAWYDECLMSECDLSAVIWMLTANDVDTLPSSLLDRCRVHKIGTPEPAYFDVYLTTILGDIARELGVSPDRLPRLDPAAIQVMRRAFRRNSALRPLNRAVRAALASAPRVGAH